MWICNISFSHSSTSIVFWNKLIVLKFQSYFLGSCEWGACGELETDRNCGGGGDELASSEASK